MGRQGAEAETPEAAAPGKAEGQPQKPPEAKPAKAEEAKGGKGAAQPAPVAAKEESAATAPRPNYEALYKSLQKTHEATVAENTDLRGKLSINEVVLQKIGSLERRLDMRDGEAVMGRVEQYAEGGNEKAADDLAKRELSRRTAILGIDPETDLRLAHLKLVPPRVALHQFLTQEPSLIQAAAFAPPKPKTETPPASADPAPAAEEKIGGKTLKELESEWAKKHGLFKALPDQPAGQTTEGFGGKGGTDLIMDGLRQYHDSQD